MTLSTTAADNFEQSQILSDIIASLKSTSGSDFFNTLTQQLDNIIDADYTFIARLDRARWISKTISLVAKGSIAENFEYSLTDTPCADVSDDSTCVYPQGICGLYPRDQLLIDMNIEGYIGAPLHSSKGEVMGLVVALYEKPIKNEALVKSLFELFSGRISAEIERVEREEQLEQLNNNLEKMVAERTAELSTALEHLKSTQEQMVEQERLASLGGLVAGVAHEINTPLGVAMLSSSNMVDIVNKLNKKVEQQTLSKTELTNGIDDLVESGESLAHNLRRAADLISNFKQVAVERNTNDIMEVELTQWLDSQLASVQPLLKQNAIQLQTDFPTTASKITTATAKLSQVLVNLVQNCVLHAFESTQNDKTINISCTVENDYCTLIVADNGIGIDNNIKDKIFDPFVTTKRNSGGTGLGLSIVHSIVTGNLTGQINMQANDPKGTRFIISFPQTLGN